MPSQGRRNPEGEQEIPFSEGALSGKPNSRRTRECTAREIGIDFGFGAHSPQKLRVREIKGDFFPQIWHSLILLF